MSTVIKIIAFLLLFLAVIFGTYLLLEKFGTRGEEESLALGQDEVDEEGVVEVASAQIIQEDEEVVHKEINIDDYHFALSIDTGGLQIKTPVVDGVSSASLSRGVGRHVSTATPNAESGNVVLSGHQWFPGNSPAHKVFENLDTLEVGQEVELKYGDEIFRYKVRTSEVVEPTDVSILEPTEEPQLTLYTCYPRYTTEKRLVYIADLIDVQKI